MIATFSVFLVLSDSTGLFFPVKDETEGGKNQCTIQFWKWKNQAVYFIVADGVCMFLTSGYFVM